MRSNIIIAAIALVVAAGYPKMATAQELPELKTGQTVWAVTSKGVQIKGEVIDLSPTALEIRHKGQQMSLPLGDLQRIEVRDSLKNGAKIGGVAGAIALGFMFGMSEAFSCGIFSTGCDTHPEAWTVLGGVVGAGAGALAGAGIDRLIPGRRVVYESNGATTVAVSPSVGTRGVGARVSVSW